MKQLFLLVLFLQALLAEEIYASFDVFAINQSKLAFEVGGIVKEITATVSKQVKKGDILIKLNASGEEIGLKNAKNEEELAQIAYNNAKSKMDKFKQVQNVIDKQSFEDIETNYKQAELNLAKAKINVERYEDALEKKILRAPYDGIISAKYIDLAQGVAPVQQVVMEIFSYPEVKLLISFDEKFKDKVKVGQIYRYKINGEQKEAKIALVYPSIDIKTRKIFAEIYTTNLTPGLFGEGVIIAD
ncbi:efflux RND transporter periplasmic adaptor subunit [Campylobacter troglodytis]|uniref:efflux RND transporter periplasmic adaptor subunit n=1 Tax=Campylobacter troglodytis TaxID=654363 RepID=UPI001156EA66|nr:efflux RND transporter periplasmic adaptor subunit [Campylobacter troglodytis]TQR60270.1 efflux RND transporter periplasmic adaptor subunit [Campylobacter troglodytis]